MREMSNPALLNFEMVLWFVVDDMVVGAGL